MLRVTLEIIPDENEYKKFGTIVRYIDIKEDGSGSYLEGNYKTRFYKTPTTKGQWRFKQVVGMKYKGFLHERLLCEALKPWIHDMENGLIEKTRVEYLADAERRVEEQQKSSL
jgi:hypothetical protein